MKSKIAGRRIAKVLSVLSLGAFLAFSSPAVSLALIAEGDKALPFRGSNLQGDALDISPLVGKQIIVIKFGSIYCSSCVQSITAFSELQKRHPVDVVKVVEVNLDIFGTFRVKKFYQGIQDLIRFPVLVDKDLAISNSYGVTSLPAVAVIGKDGKIAKIVRGYQEKELEGIIRYIEDLVAERVTAPTRKDVKLAGMGDEGGGFSILFPTNFTKTQQETLYIIGGLAIPNGVVNLTLNGGSRRQIQAKRNLYYIRTPLSLGSNYIEIAATGEKGDTATKAIVLFREPKIGKGIEAAFPLYRFHSPDNEKRCTQCHEINPPQSNQQNFQMITKLCQECHKELAENSYVHGPIPVGGCAPCHDFASQPTRYQLFSQGTDLCYGCHQEKKDEFGKTYIHGPLAAGVCSVCHNPHGSNEKFQLRSPQGQLCTLCHQQIKEETMRRSKHKPFDEGRCSACHDPHSSNNPKYFLRRYGDDLCYSCHDEKSLTGHRHPVGVVPIYAFPGIKLNELGELICTSCHHPHSSDADKLLPPQGCAACHTF